jgi:hypothetical protein
MNAIVKQRKTRVGECYLETWGVSKVKTANEITCDYKLYPPPIFVISSKLYIRETPFVLRLSLWTWVHELLLACLINLLPESFWCPLSLCLSPPATFLGVHPGFGGWCFYQLNALGPLGGPPLPGTTSLCWSGGGSLSPSEPRRRVPVAQTNMERLRNQPGSPTHQTGKNPGSNSGGRPGVWSTLKSTQVMPFWGVKLCLSGSGSRVEVLCCVRVCESASLRCSLVMKQVWSPDPWVCCELRWSTVSPNRASGLGLIQTYYGQETPKSLRGCSCRQWTKWVVLFVLPCVPEKRIPYLLSTGLIPSVFVSV